MSPSSDEKALGRIGAGTNAEWPPPISAWLWKPWYARLWWTSIAIWWLAISGFGAIDQQWMPFPQDYVYILLIFLHPFTAAIVLGLFWFKAVYDTVPENENEHDEADNLYEGGGSVGFHHPTGWLADPMNPQSLNNTANPLSPLNPANPVRQPD